MSDLASADADDLYSFGCAHYNSGQYRDALSALEKAVELNPQHGYSRYHLGLTLGELGQYEAALRQLNEAAYSCVDRRGGDSLRDWSDAH